MANNAHQLPQPTFFGINKPRVAAPQRQLDPVHIQLPCSISRYDTPNWELITPEAMIQLVKQPTTRPGMNEETIRVLNLQNHPIVFQPLTGLNWNKLNESVYELDIMQDKETLLNVYAIRFNSEQDAVRFNQVFDEIKKNTAAIFPFLQPLADAIRRGDVEDALSRFRFLCEFQDQDLKLRIKAQIPLTPEEIEMQKSIRVPISVENCIGSQAEISLRVPKDSKIADLKEIMYLKYEIPLEVQKWLDEESLLKNSEPVLDKAGEPRKIYLYILNAAKVGLNREEFLGKLEAYKNNLQQKKCQTQAPVHEEDVPVGMPQGRDDRFDMPVGPNQQRSMSMSIPGGKVQPPYMPHPDGMGSIPQLSNVQTHPSEEEFQSQEPQFLPGIWWSCPEKTCTHVNAWENAKCERCRRERPVEQPK